MEAKVIEEGSGEQVTHVALPAGILQEMIQLIATEIPWGKADAVMSVAKANTIPVSLVESKKPPIKKPPRKKPAAKK